MPCPPSATMLQCRATGVSAWPQDSNGWPGYSRPFHAATAALLDRSRRTAAFAIHSFTPVMGGKARPSDIGLPYRRDTDTSPRLRDALAARHRDLLIGMNEPCQIDDASGWFVPRHCEPRGLAHSLIEIRNDHIRHVAGQAASGSWSFPG